MRIIETPETLVCRGCAAYHHKRCTGFTDTYLKVNGALTPVPCSCPRCHPNREAASVQAAEPAVAAKTAPNGTRTRHNFRVPQSVWRPALERAHSLGKSMSDVVEERLLRYLADGPEVTERHSSTPQRTVKVSDDVWDRAKKIAEASNQKLSEVIRREFEAWLTESEED